MKDDSDRLFQNEIRGTFMSKLYNDFIALVKEINNLRAAEDILQWDQETHMPPRGVEDRSLQLAALSSVIHEKLTSRTMGDYIKELRSEGGWRALGQEQRVNVREVEWEYHRASAIPLELVKEIAMTKSVSSKNWQEARKRSDFSIFSPYLSQLVELKKKVAEAIGYENESYDALLDEFEPGLKTSQVRELFSRLRDKLVPIVSKINDSGIRPDRSIATHKYPVEKQIEFNHEVARKLGLDFERGRIDVSAHPFTTGTLHDTRFTTHYKPDNMLFALFATIHETGHALYVQGSQEEHYGTPMGQPVSFAIHESQSRMWENIVGRSIHFWRHFYPRLQETFPGQLGNTTLEDFHAVVNDVHPSLIRVQADEATYNLHILLRFEMENALFSNEIEPIEASGVWNEKIEKYLSIEVPDDSSGVLQDIHWSLGYFGYFPTYCLGNLYASQFFEQANRDIPDLMLKIENGEFRVLLEWLRSNIQEKGRFYRAGELVKILTGKPLDEDIFIDYLNTKFGELYGF